MTVKKNSLMEYSMNNTSLKLLKKEKEVRFTNLLEEENEKYN